MSNKLTNTIENMEIVLLDDGELKQVVNYETTKKTGDKNTDGGRGAIYQSLDPMTYSITFYPKNKKDYNKLASILLKPKKVITLDLAEVGVLKVRIVESTRSFNYESVPKYRLKCVIDDIGWKAAINYVVKIDSIIKIEEENLKTRVTDLSDHIKKNKIDTSSVRDFTQDIQDIKTRVKVFQDGIGYVSEFINGISTTVRELTSFFNIPHGILLASEGVLYSAEELIETIGDLAEQPEKLYNRFMALIDRALDIPSKFMKVFEPLLYFLSDKVAMGESDLNRRGIVIGPILRKKFDDVKLISDFGNQVVLLATLKTLRSDYTFTKEELNQYGTLIQILYNTLPDPYGTKYNKIDTVWNFITNLKTLKLKTITIDRPDHIFNILLKEYGHINYIDFILSLNVNKIKDIDYLTGDLVLIDESND